MTYLWHIFDELIQTGYNSAGNQIWLKRWTFKSSRLRHKYWNIDQEFYNATHSSWGGCKFSFSIIFELGFALRSVFFSFLRPESRLVSEIILVFYFTLADVQLRLNRYGGSFGNGRALPALYRVLDLYHDGFGNRQIAWEVRSRPGFVQKVIDRYNEQNTSLRGIRVGYPSPKIDEQAVEYIEVQKNCLKNCFHMPTLTLFPTNALIAGSQWHKWYAR